MRHKGTVTYAAVANADVARAIRIFGDQDYGQGREELLSVLLDACGYRWICCTGAPL
jgi:hypothetical protein